MIHEAVPIEGVSPAHTSEPRDQELQLDPRAGAHLVAVAAAPAESGAVAALLDAWAARPTAPLELVLTTHPLLGALEVPAGALVTVVPDAVSALATFQRRLPDQVVGVRVYMAGPESFVRRATSIARAAGMCDEEIIAAVTSSRARRIWCVHCRSITDTVEETIVDCVGCGRKLLAYHHYSRRQDAYLGFQVNAEDPDDIPEPETAWP